jgi:hypothetical protein
MMGCKNRASCRNLFRRLGILQLVSQYIFSLMLFVVENKHFFYIELRNLYQKYKGVHYMGIKIFNRLPPYLKDYPIMLGNLKLV